MAAKTVKRASSSNSVPATPLLRKFVERSPSGGSASPEEAMESLIRDCVRRKRLPEGTRRLDGFLRERKVIAVDGESSLDCDGYIEPMGRAYSDGFRIKLNDSVPPVRRRFTLAHEACHTFFYELVPEIKFRPHTTDEGEERLCNFGAAALLIPIARLRRRAKNLPPSIAALQALASEFEVSLPAMLLRLRAVGLWELELSIWRRLTNGSFAMDRIYGSRYVPWRWVDERDIAIAWGSRSTVFGSSFVLLQRERSGALKFRPVVYEAQRRDDHVLVLWGRGLKRPRTRPSTLF